MRTIFLILIIAVIALIIGVKTGYIDTRQTQEARLPQVGAQGGKVTVQAGQAPKFDVQTGSVGVGSADANVAVPTIKVQQGSRTVKVPAIVVHPPQQQPAAQPATNQAQ